MHASRSSASLLINASSRASAPEPHELREPITKSRRVMPLTREKGRKEKKGPSVFLVVKTEWSVWSSSGLHPHE